MRDEQKFFQLLKPLRRQLLWVTILKYGQIFVLLCSGIWFIWQIFGRLFFIYHLGNWFHVLFFLVFVYCAICFFRDKPSWYQTVLIMNEFIPDDLVLTAYSVLTKEGELERLIVRAANKTIPQYLEQALKRKKRYVSFPHLVVSLLFISGGLLSYLFPNEMLELNRQAREEKQIIREFKEDVVTKLQEENLPQLQEDLERVESLEELRDIIEKAYRELALAEQKEREKRQELQRDVASLDLPELSAALEEGDHVTAVKELTQLQKDHSRLSSEAHKILSRAFGSNFLELEEKDLHSLVMDLLNQSSNEQIKNTLDHLATSFNEMVEKNELAHTVPPLELDNFSRHIAKSERKEENGHSHQPPSPQQSESKRPSSTGTAQPTNETDNNASTGNGGAQGPWGSANGATGGHSSGAGSGTTSRLLTIPEYIDSELQIEEDFGPLEEGASRFQKGGGQAVHGQLRPYEEVFSHYQEAVNHSMERIQLPPELEEVARNYFLHVKP